MSTFKLVCRTKLGHQQLTAALAILLVVTNSQASGSVKSTVTYEAIFSHLGETLEAHPREHLLSAVLQSRALCTLEAVLIVGHADTTESQDKHMDLSTRRAEYVKDQMLLRGLNPDKVLSTGVGNRNPLAEAGSPINRRVDIVLTGSFFTFYCHPGDRRLEPVRRAAFAQFNEIRDTCGFYVKQDSLYHLRDLSIYRRGHSPELGWSASNFCAFLTSHHHLLFKTPEVQP